MPCAKDEASIFVFISSLGLAICVVAIDAVQSGEVTAICTNKPDVGGGALGCGGGLES